MKDPRDVHFLSLLTAKKQGQIDIFDGYLFWLKQEQTFITWLLGIMVTGFTFGASQLQLWSDSLSAEEIWLLAFLVCACLISGFEYRITLNEMFKFNLNFQILAKSVFLHEEMKMSDSRKTADDPYERIIQGLYDLNEVKSNSEYLNLLREYEHLNDHQKAEKFKEKEKLHEDKYSKFFKENVQYLDDKYNKAFNVAYGNSLDNSSEPHDYKKVKKKFNLLNQIFYWSFRILIVIIFLLIILKT